MPMPSAPNGAGSQTLSRGLRVLEILADASEPLSIDDVARQLGVHRSVAYRLIRTLEEHGLVVRKDTGGLALGTRLAALAAGVERDLQAVAVPELTLAARDLRMTCFLAVYDRGECLTFASVEPPQTVAVVAQRPGTRHPVTLGAPGKAILSILPEEQWPEGITREQRAQVENAVAKGWAETTDEVIMGLHSVGVPLTLDDGQPAALAAVFVGEGDRAEIAARLGRAAAVISHGEGSGS
ncbi:IclR family transcriptional regulator [Rothia uropygioeca]|uniref:IclR family transcriptional regulator n=1 Tax=Kocuria sp. 257 TaxID=2021970 RepID=UPI001010DFCC|nr:helix-turn-helix domain-containing protein [Kocuria sp. 257]